MDPELPKLRPHSLRDAIKIVRKAPGIWLTVGLMITASWFLPKLFLWMLTGLSPGTHYAALMEFEISERIRPVLAATTWSCMAGGFRMAHAHVRGIRPGAGDFIGGFFGGFLLLLPAIFYEAVLPDGVVWHEAVVLLLVPLWPLGSAMLAAMGARTPLLKCLPEAVRLLTGRYGQWLKLEAGLAVLTLAGGLLFGLGLPIAAAIRVLAISLAVRDLFPAEPESLSSPMP